MTPGPGIEPRPQRWEASALTTAPSLFPYIYFYILLYFFYILLYSANYTHCNHKNYNFLTSVVISLIKLLFCTNSLAKLLSDSLLSDSSIRQSHSKLSLKSTNHIQSCSYLCKRACTRSLLCFCHLIASGRHCGLRMFTSPLSVF